MTAIRGKWPSLVTGSRGRPKFEIVKRKRTCKRCGKSILAGAKCVSIPIAGSMGSKTYCCSCLLRIIEQSRSDLDELESRCNS